LTSLFPYKIFRLFIPLLFFYYPSTGQTTHSPAVISRLSTAIGFETYSVTGRSDFSAYNNFINWLDISYPLVKRHLEKKIINNYSLLLHWKGKDSSVKPVLFVAHYDVVPAGDPQNWKAAPFSGLVDSGFVWGRGTLDDKAELVSLIEAIESLLEENFIPDQSVYVAIGHDEETGGMEGAAKIADYIGDQKILFDFTLDEGGAVMNNVFPGLDKQVAFIATAEKGYADFRIEAHTAGGHSSVPPAENAIQIISNAITRIRANPMEAKLQVPVTDMLKTLGPHLEGKSKFGIRHMGLFRKKVLKTLAANNNTNALIRTSLTPTMIQAGSANNVLPASAFANINARIVSGETVSSVFEYLEKIIADDKVRITISPSSHEPSPVSSIHTTGYSLIKETIEQIFPGVITSPVLSPAMSDSRHYVLASANVYRFSPVTISAENKEEIHGVNERIGVEDYYKVISFYKTLLKKLKSKK
jgi:carboxypeptidase PM20D1